MGDRVPDSAYDVVPNGLPDSERQTGEVNAIQLPLKCLNFKMGCMC